MNKERYFHMINQLSDKELVKHLYFTQLLLLIVSVILGMFVFKLDLSFFTLFRFHFNHFLIGLASGVVIVAIDILFMNILPEKYQDDGGINHRIFTGRNPFHIMIIAAVVAISEEILFRGIVQTKLGLLISSVIFAIIHYRYLFNRFLFANIIVLSFLMGYLFQITNNLSVTIIMHFTIDFLLGMIIRYKLFGYKKSTN
ncbi:lysostaphin resistance A-like protein [Niallia sp. 01092]|uniref:lysostaphin resistance A-like protein n=1 Tax=unclassified Niallia TaxID=2837522 RepID=UPI003FD23D76